MTPFPSAPTVDTVMEWFATECGKLHAALDRDWLDADGSYVADATEDHYMQVFAAAQHWLDAELWNYTRQQVAEQTGDLPDDMCAFWDGYVEAYRRFQGQVSDGSITHTHETLVNSRARIAERASRYTGVPAVESSVDPYDTVHVLVANVPTVYGDNTEYICSYTPDRHEAYTQIAILVDEIRRQNNFLAERYYDRMYWTSATPHHSSRVETRESVFAEEGPVGQSCVVSDFRFLVPQPVSDSYSLGMISRDNVDAWHFRIDEVPVGSVAFARLRALPNVWERLFRHYEHLDVRRPEYTPYMRELEYEAYVDSCEEAFHAAALAAMPPLPPPVPPSPIT